MRALAKFSPFCRIYPTKGGKEKTPRIPTAEAEGSRGKKGTGLALKREAATQVERPREGRPVDIGTIPTGTLVVILLARV